MDQLDHPPEELDLQRGIIHEDSNGMITFKNCSLTICNEIDVMQNEAEYEAPPLQEKEQGPTYKEHGDYDSSDEFTNELHDDEEIDRFEMQVVIDHYYDEGKLQVLVLWATGEETWEPAHIIQQDDPLSIVEYARGNNLLST